MTDQSHSAAVPPDARPAPPSNPFFGVGPITDMAQGPEDAARIRADFETWLTDTYRKTSDTGADLGGFTLAELSRSMHRGHPADAILKDMAHHIHRYFGFPATSHLALGIGGGHSGFTSIALHLLDPKDPAHHVFVDTRRPEDAPGGFFRQLWGTQLIEMMETAQAGDPARIHFASAEGVIPSADELCDLGIRLFFGVGHETSGASSYSQSDLDNLLAWIDRDPDRHIAVIDATSMLGAMPWPQDTIDRLMAACAFFMPFQKAIGGISGYYAISLPPRVRTRIDALQETPQFAIPRQFKLAVPQDPGRPLSSRKSVEFGPVYDPVQDRMLGGIINTFSAVAFAETTFGLLRVEKLIGPVETMNARSLTNRAALRDWIDSEPLFAFSVPDEDRQGCAVTLLKVTDPEITDPAVMTRIVERSKGLLDYRGLTFADGTHEPGMDAARYVNAFPGTPGDYRAWIGGIRTTEDIIALLTCLRYAYRRAKLAVLQET